MLVGDEEAKLSRTEWELLAQLAANAGRVMMHTELLSRIWGPEFRMRFTIFEPGSAACAQSWSKAPAHRP